ncbi:MAG: hypothetical protein IJF13_09345 [Clostridia bacterium]|nr:hypothetical protein [Clostridia bacterium]
MERFWPYAWAFSIMCIIYTICKIVGFEWTAERPWQEVIFFLCVAILIITLFFLRKKIAALYEAIKNKLPKK